MKRRRVSAAFVELDTADVIRTKDQKECACEAEVFASSPRLAETTTKVNFQSSKKASGKKGGQHMDNDNKCHHASFYNHRTDDSSHLTDIAPKPRDTKHAMATRCHKPASRLSSSLAGSKSAKKNDQQHPTNNHDMICDVELRSPQGMMVARSASVATNTEQNPGASSTTTRNNGASQSPSFHKEPKSTRSSIQGYLIPSRPRRSTRRTHALQKETNVDWSEDLRPTDDDSLQGCEEEDEARTSVKAELASSKRKRQQRVSKRRNSPALDVLGLGVMPNPTGVDDSPDMPKAAGFAKQSPSGTDLAVNKERRIEISSCSSGANDQPMTEADAEAAGNEQQLRTHDARGRGKTVGQKLAVALHGSKKAYRTRRVFGSRSHPLRASGKTSTSQKIVGVTVSRVHSPRITRSQALMGPTIEVGQTRHTLSNGEAKPAESDTSSLALITGILSEETVALADKADLDIHCPSNNRERSNITKPRPEPGKDGAIRYKEILDSYPQSLQSSHAKAIDVEIPLADNQKEPQLNPSLLESEKEVSSQPSVVSEANCGTSFRQDTKSEKTPDSQRPLLLDKSRASVPEINLSRRCQRSAQRGCTVDHNGSPRLKSQLTMSTGQIACHLEMGRIRSRFGISDSSSIRSYSSDYDESLEDYSLEHQPVAGPIWTKFQRDMFKEYGIEADELIKQKAKPFLLTGKTPDKACAKSLKGNQQLDTRPLESVPHMGKTSSGESDNESAIRGKSSEGPQRLSGQGSNPTTDEAPPCTRVSSKLDPTQITSTMQSDSENVEWTTALKNAQQTAHDQLLETNQVSLIY